MLTVFNLAFYDHMTQGIILFTVSFRPALGSTQPPYPMRTVDIHRS